MFAIALIFSSFGFSPSSVTRCAMHRTDFTLRCFLSRLKQTPSFLALLSDESMIASCSFSFFAATIKTSAITYTPSMSPKMVSFCFCYLRWLSIFQTPFYEIVFFPKGCEMWSDGRILCKGLHANSHLSYQLSRKAACPTAAIEHLLEWV